LPRVRAREDHRGRKPRIYRPVPVTEATTTRILAADLLQMAKVEACGSTQGCTPDRFQRAA
jgi:hypothetical protein